MNEKELQLQERLNILQKEWGANPLSQSRRLIDAEREAIPINPNISASAFDFEVKEGNTTYEVVGHFNSDASENLLQKIFRMLKGNKSLQTK